MLCDGREHLNTLAADVVALPQVLAGADAPDPNDVDVVWQQRPELRCVGQADRLHGLASDTSQGASLVRGQCWLVAGRVGPSVGECVGGGDVVDIATSCDHRGDFCQKAWIAVWRQLDSDVSRLCTFLAGPDQAQDRLQGVWIEADDLVLRAVIANVGAAEVELDRTAPALQSLEEAEVATDAELGQTQDELVACDQLLETFVGSLRHGVEAAVGHAPGVHAVQRVPEVFERRTGVAGAGLGGDGADDDHVGRSGQGADLVEIRHLAQAGSAHDERILWTEGGKQVRGGLAHSGLDSGTTVFFRPGRCPIQWAMIQPEDISRDKVN